MSKKILFVTATGNEAGVLRKIPMLTEDGTFFRYRDLDIYPLVTGVGSVATAWAMKDWININGKPELAINAGIAGTYNDNIKLGDVVMPQSDCFADTGVEDGNRFLTLFESGLAGSNEFPYVNGILQTDSNYLEKFRLFIKPVKAITVNTATGSMITANCLKEKFNPDIETMEGATFFYICCRESIPFFALRSVSNKVEKRDRNKWDIPLALKGLTERLTEVFLKL